MLIFLFTIFEEQHLLGAILVQQTSVDKFKFKAILGGK